MAGTWFLSERNVEPPKAVEIHKPAHVPPAPSRESVEPSEEQRRFADEVLKPLIRNLIPDYPVPVGRSVCSGPGMRHPDGSLPITIDPTLTHPGALAYMDNRDRDHPRPILVFANIKTLYERRMRTGNLELFTDELLVTLAHECLHAELGHAFHNDDLASLAADEQEAWYETARRYLVPLRAAGRLKGLQNDTIIYDVLRVWDASGGDASDPLWKQLGREAKAPDAR